MKRKKITAILLASLMAASMAPQTAWAADSYKETEKAAFAKAIEEMSTEYAADLSQLDTEKVQGNAKITLNLDDGGKAIAGMLSPVDISWLDQASLDTNVVVSDTTLTEFMDVDVNGTKICTVEYYMDTVNSVIYMRIPELNDGYIKMDLLQLTEDAEEEIENDSSFSTSMDISEAMSSYFSTLDNLPAADIVQTILTRYSDIFFDNVADAENPGTQDSAAGDVHQELNVLEGHVTQKEAIPMLQQILDAAKEDEELKGLIESWTEVLNDPQYTYDTFLDALTELRDEVDVNINDTDESGFILRAWVDGDGEVVGRQILMDEGNGEENLVSYLATTDGDKRGFTLQLSADSESLALEGSGEMNGDLLSGTYTVLADGETIAQIDVTDYDTKATQEGNWNGTYTFSGVPEVAEDGSTYDPFGGMQLVFTTAGKDADNVDWNLALVSSGVSLGSVSLTGNNEGEALETADIASLTDVYDFSVDDDVENYVSSMDLTTITDSLTSAGMPEGWLDSVMEAMDGAGDTQIDTEEGITEDQTDMAGDTLEEDAETPAA